MTKSFILAIIKDCKLGMRLLTLITYIVYVLIKDGFIESVIKLFFFVL